MERRHFIKDDELALARKRKKWTAAVAAAAKAMSGHYFIPRLFNCYWRRRRWQRHQPYIASINLSGLFSCAEKIAMSLLAQVEGGVGALPACLTDWDGYSKSETLLQSPTTTTGSIYCGFPSSILCIANQEVWG
jgi:hypothetical protein